MRRGHTVEDYVSAMKLCKNFDIKTTAHIIIGLPCETHKQMIETGKFAIDSGIDGIKIHSLYIIKNTELDRLYKINNYKLLTLDEYADIVVEILKYVPESVVIHRLTGETDKDRISAPDWVNDKNKVLNSIKKKLMNI